MKRLSPDIIFESAHRNNDLATKSVKSGISTMGAQGVQVILQTASTVVLARLLTPADYGLIGMVTVIVNLAQMFKDAGLSMATVQQEKISHEQISTLFWVNVLISVGLGVIILICSPLVANFYDKPELTAVTAVLSISFISSGLSIQHTALLRRHMRFNVLAIVQISAQVLALLMTIILAFYGWRYWALVGGTLVTTFVTIFLTFFYCPWIPGRPQKGTGARNMLKFGGHITGFNLVNYFARNSDNILIGRFIGADALGIYSKAYNLCLLPIRQIRGPLTNVAMPILSSLQKQPDRYTSYFLRFLDIVATLTIPIMLYCFVEAKFLIELLLGPQWSEAVPVFRILAIAGVVEPIFGTVGVVMLSLGHSERYLKLGIVNSILIVFSFVIGIQYGVIGVAMSFAIISYLKIVPSTFYCFHGTPITVKSFLFSYVPPTTISIISFIFSFVIRDNLLTNSIYDNFIFLISFILIYSIFSLMRKSIRGTVVRIYGSLSSRKLEQDLM